MRYGSKVLFDDVTTTFSAGRRYGLTGPNGVGQVHVHEAPDRRAAAAEGHGRRGRRSSASCARTSSRSTSSASSTPSIMGNPRLWQALQEREALYAKTEMTDADGMRLGELEGIVGEEDGYTAESDAAILLQGLDIADELHERTMAELQGGQKVRVLLAQALFGQPAGAAARRADQPSGPRLDPLAARVPRPLRGHADRDLARPALPERRLHAHRGHRLPDDHHLHRRLRRHGRRQDADSHRGSRPRTRSARRRSRSSRLHRALLRRHARQPGAVAAKEVERLQTTELARSNIQRPYIKFTMNAPVGQARARVRGRVARRYGEHRGHPELRRDRRTAARRSSSSAATAPGKTTLLKALLADAPGCRRRRATVDGGTRALGPRGVDRLLPAGSHRRDRERA